MALEAILGDLGQNMVEAYSGRRPCAPSCNRTSR